ncbi:MAG: hypothetical protein ACXIUM_12805 [Wenzhouxiangella sp.]
MRALSLILLALLLLGLTSQTVAAEKFFDVEAELWIEGVQRGTPSLRVAAHSEARLETGDADERWRLEIEVEPVDDLYAPVNTLWVHVAVHHLIDGHWDHLLDSIVGVPEGEVATLSVVDGGAAATPATAAVYLRIRTTRAAE